MPHFWGSCANVLFATVSGVVPGNGILLVTKMLVHFCFEHLFNRPGEKPLQLRLNISCRSDKQVYLAVRHQQLYQFHLSFIKSVCSFHVQYLTFSWVLLAFTRFGIQPRCITTKPHSSALVFVPYFLSIPRQQYLRLRSRQQILLEQAAHFFPFADGYSSKRKRYQVCCRGEYPRRAIFHLGKAQRFPH